MEDEAGAIGEVPQDANEGMKELAPPKVAHLSEEKKQKLKIDLADNTKMITATTWDALNLKPDLMRGVFDKGFAAPSIIQESALPLILNSNTNFIGQAKNGAGKTATFVLASLQKVDESNPDLQVVVISPTRELAQQNLDVFKEIGKHLAIDCRLAVPGHEDFPSGTHVISGTAGTLQMLLSKKKINFRSLKVLILDEADKMLMQELEPSSYAATHLKSVAQKATLSNAQLLLFSATYPIEVRKLAMNFAPTANKITVETSDLTIQNLKQTYILFDNQNEKLRTLCDLYASMTIGQTIIFVNKIDDGRIVSEFLRNEGYAITLIAGGGKDQKGLTPDERDKRMEEFRNGNTRVLVATDVLARGIDVPQVSLVINFDLPVVYGTRQGTVDTETYLHRIGRTGRMGKAGLAINLTTRDQIFLINQLKEYYSCEVEEIPADFDALTDILQGLERK